MCKRTKKVVCMALLAAIAAAAVGCNSGGGSSGAGSQAANSSPAESQKPEASQESSSAESKKADTSPADGKKMDISVFAWNIEDMGSDPEAPVYQALSEKFYVDFTPVTTTHIRGQLLIQYQRIQKQRISTR